MIPDKNVILCGFMGCGKSTVGAALAHLIGADFIDMDRFIETRENKTIPEIFSLCGEEGFRDLEHAAALEISRRRGVVVATGGGALTIERNVAVLRSSGYIVFLSTPFDECYRRVKDSNRPLVLSNTRERLEGIYLGRQKLYRAAACLELDGSLDPQEAASAIAALLGL